MTMCFCSRQSANPVLLRCAQLIAILAAVCAQSVFAHGEAGEHADNGSTALNYSPASTGTRELSLGPVTIRMLAEASNLGRDDIEVGELRLPPEYGEGAAHQHGSLELFYVVEGILGHEVNGVAHRLEPGMLGFVKPGDSVRHSVLSPGPMRAVVIWLPGGEADRLIEHAGFEVRQLP